MRRESVLRLLLAGSTALTILVSASFALGHPQNRPTTRLAPVATRHATFTSVARLQAPAQRLVYDPNHDAIWFVEMLSGSPTSLDRYVVTTGTITKFRLPQQDYNGYTTTLAVTPSGAVWVGLPYALARWDPSTQAVSVIDLPQQVSGQSSTAFDISQPLAGTWVSSIAASGEDVAVSRLNVPFVDFYDSQGTVQSRTPTPSTYAGSRQMLAARDGGVYVLPGYLASDTGADVIEVHSDGSTTDVGIGGVTDMTPTDSGTQFDTVSSTGSTTSLAAGLTVGSLPELPASAFTATRRFGQVSAGWDQSTSALFVSSPSGTERLDVPSVTGPGSAGVVSTTSNVIRDVVVTADGRVWALTDAGMTLSTVGY